MIYGLIGASGTGKTTLAQDVVEALNLNMVITSITDSARLHGVEAVANLPLDKRIKLQRHLLDDHAKLLAAVKAPSITDRTPIDMIGYLMCEIGMHSHEQVSQEMLREANKYVNDCKVLTKERYDMVFMLSPLLDYEPDPKRPSVNPAYQRHTDLVMRGALHEMTEMAFATIVSQSRTVRFNYVCETIVERLDWHDDFRKKAKHIN